MNYIETVVQGTLGSQPTERHSRPSKVDISFFYPGLDNAADGPVAAIAEGDGNGIRRYDFPGSLRSRRADREGRPSCNHAWHFDFAARQLLPSPSRATCCRNNAGILSK